MIQMQKLRVYKTFQKYSVLLAFAFARDILDLEGTGDSI